MEGLIWLLPFALLLICPVAMIFMMRGGMHGGQSNHEGHGAQDAVSDPATATKLAAMEREIAQLRGELDAAGGAETVAQGRNGSRA